MVEALRYARWFMLVLVSVSCTPAVWSGDNPDSRDCTTPAESAASEAKSTEAAECADATVSLDRDTHPAESVSGRLAGEREAAQSKGLEFHGFLKSEGSTNFHSGLSSDGTDFRGLLETGVSLDLQKAIHWHGGRVSASLHDYFGSNASEALIADAQGFSNIDSSPMNRIYELWFEQSFSDGKVRLKVGRIDANTEFAYVENATEFLNSSMGFSPTILGFGTYPEPRTGGLMALKPNDSFFLTLGDFRCPVHGDMAIGEIGTRWKLTGRLMPGRLAFGSWIHPHNREDFMGNMGFGVHGYYLVAEQMLWNARPGKSEDSRGLRAFAQWGDADPMFNGIAWHQGIGVEWIGPFSARPSDVVGAGFTGVRLGEAYFQLPASGRESSVESFYKFRMRSWMGLTADFQSISSSPVALTQTRPYVATLRLTLSY